MSLLAPEIFKAYDIRGIVDDTLTLNSAYLIGRAIGATAIEKGVSDIAVGRDGRLSGPSLLAELARGLQESGLNVLNIGMVATPMLYFAAHTLTQASGVMVTGSHNPPNYNGFKMMIAGETLSGDAIQALRVRIETHDLPQKTVGAFSETNIAQAYQDHIVADIKPKRGMKIAIDAGNGVAGAFAGDLYRALGCEVTELFCDVDGHFPNHHPDPAKPENLQDLIHTLQTTDCEIGLAFDGDGDRLGVVTKDGHIIWPDRQLMLFAQDVLVRHPNAQVIYDVKSTGLLQPWIKHHGGQPIMARTGHSFIKAKMKETGALIAGEMSGHIFFKERWFGFDDGMYAGARLIEILSVSGNPNQVLNQLPNAISTPELNLQMAKEGDNHALIAKLQAEAQFPSANEVISIDGLRVEYQDGFGLMRASNTTPVIVFRFEAETEQGLQRIQDQFKHVLQQHTDLPLPF